MANPALFVSSCVVSVIHALCMLLYWPCVQHVPAWSWTLGLATSVWNHGVTCPLAKWGDRVMMGVATGMDLFYAPNATCAFFVVGAVTSYLSAKHVSGQPGLVLHAGSHGLITTAHVLMLASYS
jgi:hypothetical protein